MDQLLPCMYLTKSSRLSDCQSMESRSWTLWFISSISPGDVTSVHRRSSHSTVKQWSRSCTLWFISSISPGDVISVHRRSSHSQSVRLNCIPIWTTFAVLNGGLLRCGETKSALKVFDIMLKRGVLPDQHVKE